jgi:hypothetical protein
LGTICPWGLNWLGTVCPEGPINWGPIVGDQMSGDHMRLGPNVSQPVFGLFLITYLLPTYEHFQYISYGKIAIFKTTYPPLCPYVIVKWSLILYFVTVFYPLRNLKRGLLPCTSTGSKIFWAGPNFWPTQKLIYELCQT